MKSKCCKAISVVKPVTVQESGKTEYIWFCSQCNTPCEVHADEPRYLKEPIKEVEE